MEKKTTAPRLSNNHVHTLEHMYEHPTTHTLEWHDVIALLGHLGSAQQKADGHLVFTLNGVTKGFHRSQEKEVSEVQQVMDLREFLKDVVYKKSE